MANEPSVFWDGSNQSEVIARWCEEWFDPIWGSVEPTPLNGSSGAKIDKDIFEPLGVQRNDVWFTDAVNTYFVKAGDSQGRAIAGRFKEFADSISLENSRRPDLPSRPTPAVLVRTALTEHRLRLLDEVRRGDPPLIITLGNETLQTLAGLSDGESLPAQLSHADYGLRHTASLEGREFEVLPLKHPGNRSQAWRDTHEQWIAAVS